MYPAPATTAAPTAAAPSLTNLRLLTFDKIT
jgi:hypothetical protein